MGSQEELRQILVFVCGRGGGDGWELPPAVVQKSSVGGGRTVLLRQYVGKGGGCGGNRV